MTELRHRSFEDLDVWKEARKLRHEIYMLTKPAEEKFVLVPQVRRAALSVTNNIAEGHGRFHYQENIQFLRLSRGSLEEVLDDLTLCEDQGYVDATKAQALRQQIVRVEQLLNGYIRYLSGQKAGAVREESAEYPPGHESLITSHDLPATGHQSP